MTASYTLDRVRLEYHAAGLPLIVTPADARLASDADAARDWFAAHLPELEKALRTVSAVLFRGFAVLLNPFGTLFEEVRASDLIRVPPAASRQI